MFTTLSLDSRYEELLISLRQVSSLLTFANNIDLTSQPLESICHFLSTMHDLMRRVILLCESLANLKICA